MNSRNKALTGLFFCGVTVLGQTSASPTPLHLTINYPPASVIVPMFGALPKDVALIEVTACNDTAAPVTLSTSRVVQSLRHNGVQALSRDAAITTMQRAENRTWQSVLLRNSTHAMNIVNFLVITKSVSVGPALSNVLPSVQALMEAIVPEFSKDVPANQYLTFDHDSLPDKTQLNALECASGLLFTMKSAGAPLSELSVEAGVVSAPAPAAAPAAK